MTQPKNVPVGPPSTGRASALEQRVRLNYGEDNRFFSIDRMSGATTTQVWSGYDYDLAGRLSGLDLNFGYGKWLEYDFEYDALNRLTAVDRTANPSAGLLDNRRTDYYYDRIGQLTGAHDTFNDLLDEDFSFDATGNRTGSGYVTGDHNRLEEDGTWRDLVGAEFAIGMLWFRLEQSGRDAVRDWWEAEGCIKFPLKQAE